MEHFPSVSSVPCGQLNNKLDMVWLQAISYYVSWAGVLEKSQVKT